MNQGIMIAAMVVATVIAAPTFLAPRYARRASQRAARLAARFESEAIEKGSFGDEYFSALNATMQRMPYLVIAASANAFKFTLKETDTDEISQLIGYSNRNPWAKKYMAEAAALFVAAQFYGNPYNHRIWKLALMAGFILWSLKRTVRIETTFAQEQYSRELVRARKVRNEANGGFARC